MTWLWQMLWLTRYCLVLCLFYRPPTFKAAECALAFLFKTAVVALFSASTHIPQLSVWTQLVFDTHQRKMRYIQLCQATKLLYPVVVKTISVARLLVPQTTDIFFLQRVLSDTCLKPFNFCIDDLQPFLQSTLPIHGAQKAKPINTPLASGTCLAAAWPAPGWRARSPVCCDSRRGHNCSSSRHGGHGSGFGLHDEPVRTRSRCGLGQTASDAPARGKSRENDLGGRRKAILLGRVSLLGFMWYLNCCPHFKSRKKKIFVNFPQINSYTFLEPSSSAPHLQKARAVIHFKMSHITDT